MNFNKKTQTVLGISVAAVLAVSLFSVIGVQQTFADDDDRDTKSLKNFLKKFKNNEPHFKTALTSADTVPLVENDFSGKAKAWLIYQDGEIKLKYRLKTNMDMNAGWPQTPEAGDDITKIHLHNNVPGVAGPHVLNVQKAPAQDDGDLVLKPFKGVIRGIWDDGDKNYAAVMDPNTRQGGDSVALTEVDPLTSKVPLAELCKGNIYANVHGTITDDEGNAIGADSGSLRGNLEATDRGEKICKILDKLGVI